MLSADGVVRRFRLDKQADASRGGRTWLPEQYSRTTTATTSREWSGPGCGRTGVTRRPRRGGTVSGVPPAAIALMMAVVGVSRTAAAQEGAREDPVAITFGLGIAAPGSYDHSAGGGTSADTLNEVQWIGNYDCDDVVSFFLTVTHDPTAGGLGGSRTAEIDLEFAAGANGQPGVGLTDILSVTPVPGDPGEVGDGNSSATLLDESLDEPYTDGGTLERHRTGRQPRPRRHRGRAHRCPRHLRRRAQLRHPLRGVHRRPRGLPQPS